MGHILASTYNQSEETLKSTQKMENQNAQSTIVDIESMQTE